MNKNKKKELFHENLPADFKVPSDKVGEKMLREYGAFLSRETAFFRLTELFSEMKMKLLIGKKLLKFQKRRLQISKSNCKRRRWKP